jgi:hypothetical protein
MNRTIGSQCQASVLALVKYASVKLAELCG